MSRSTGTAQRRRRYLRGKNSERLAELWLMAKAYWPVARRYKTPFGEIDLIMRRGNTLIFVEVKRRQNLHAGAEAIHPRNQQRVVAAARAFLSTHPDFLNHRMRFDAIIIAPREWPRHIINAFT